MKLAFSTLKKIIPELNERIITPKRILEIFRQRGIDFFELNIEDDGAFVTSDGRSFVFLKSILQQLVYHETLLHEGGHALIHYPADFLERKHQLEAEVFSLVGMMPLKDLPRLNRIKHQLDAESYELLKRRNKANSIWGL